MSRTFLPAFEPGSLLKVSKRYAHAKVMASPDVNGRQISVVENNDLVFSIHEIHGWNKIVTSSGIVGWMLVSVLEKIN